MQKNLDCVLGGGRYDNSDNEDEKALDNELKQIQLNNAIKLAEAINAIQFAKPPSYLPQNYIFDMFATLYRQLRGR